MDIETKKTMNLNMKQKKCLDYFAHTFKLDIAVSLRVNIPDRKKILP